MWTSNQGLYGIVWTEPSRSFAAVGNALTRDPIREGETVLDLGCGAGTDLLLSARRTGAKDTDRRRYDCRNDRACVHLSADESSARHLSISRYCASFLRRAMVWASVTESRNIPGCWAAQASPARREGKKWTK